LEFAFETHNVQFRSGRAYRPIIIVARCTSMWFSMNMVFDEPPGPKPPRFVEVEDERAAASISANGVSRRSDVGRWHSRPYAAHWYSPTRAGASTADRGGRQARQQGDLGHWVQRPDDWWFLRLPLRAGQRPFAQNGHGHSSSARSLRQLLCWLSRPGTRSHFGLEWRASCGRLHGSR